MMTFSSRRKPDLDTAMITDNPAGVVECGGLPSTGRDTDFVSLSPAVIDREPFQGTLQIGRR